LANADNTMILMVDNK